MNDKEQKIRKDAMHTTLMFVSWVEFVLGTPITDFLGSDNPLEADNVQEHLDRFEELLKTKNINDIKAEEVWEVY